LLRAGTARTLSLDILRVWLISLVENFVGSSMKIHLWSLLKLLHIAVIRPKSSRPASGMHSEALQKSSTNECFPGQADENLFAQPANSGAFR